MCFMKETTEAADSDEIGNLTDETFVVSTQLPAFLGRFYERENAMLDNTWAVFGGKIPQGAPVLPCITQNADWVLRLSEAGPSANII